MSRQAPAARATGTAPFRFFDLTVGAASRPGPSLLRLTLTGCPPELACGGHDQRIKLFLPHPHQHVPVMPADSPDWYAAWRAMDPETRAIMRTYTVRQLRAESAEMDVEFVLHDGPATRWVTAAAPGDPVTVLAPVEADNAAVDFRPPPGTRHVLLAADATALPAVDGILRALPADLSVRGFVEVLDPGDIRSLPTTADARIDWLVRGHARGGLLAAVRAAAPEPDGGYAWLAGEAAQVRTLRRLLVGERGFDRRAVTFTGYWRRGASEDDLLAEAPTE